MAGESCNLDKDDAEIFKPSASPSPSRSPSPSSPPLPPASAAAASSSSLSPSSSSSQPSTSPVILEPCEEPPVLRPARPETSIREIAPSTEPEASVRISTNRCLSCQKKVGLTGFRCRCGDLFCGRHRYSDDHVCSFDYKAAGREQIAKANPLIKAAKIIKI